MVEIITTTFKLRRGTLQEWENKNPILADGEPGWAIDAKILKIGDGKTTWKDLQMADPGEVGRFTAANGEIFNDYENNKAYAPYSSASGSQTQAGGKGYRVSGVENNKIITLNDAHLAASGQAAYQVFSINDKLCFDGTKHHYNKIKIAQEIEQDAQGNSVITVAPVEETDTLESLIIEFDNTTTDEWENWLWSSDLGKSQFGEERSAFSWSAHTEGENSVAMGRSAHAEGRKTKAIGNYSHAEGRETEATYLAHAEGYKTKASALFSHSEGGSTESSGEYSHAEGGSTKASGKRAHAEGGGTKAVGESSHAEGNYSKAEENYAHAEGNYTRAIGQSSHAEGSNTVARGNNSHAEGEGTIALTPKSHVSGKYNTYYKIIKETISAEDLPTGKSWLFQKFIIDELSGKIKVIDYAGDTKANLSAWDGNVKRLATQTELTIDGINEIEVFYQGEIINGQTTNYYKYTLVKDETDYAIMVGNGSNSEYKILNNIISGGEHSNAYTLDWDGNAWFAGHVETTAIILPSSTPGSTKKFKLMVDDNGTLFTKEYKEEN